MQTIILPNLMFEEELAGGGGQSAGEAARRVSELIPVTGLLFPDRSTTVLIPDGSTPHELPDVLSNVRFAVRDEVLREITGTSEVIAWGWSPQAVRVSRLLGGAVHHPEVEAVYRINRRQFLGPYDIAVPADQLELAIAQTQPVQFSRECRNELDVRNAIQELCSPASSQWIVKADLSQAARNRILGDGTTISESHLGWMNRKFLAGETVTFEPWVNRVLEFGIQFEVSRTPAGPSSVCVGVTRLLTLPGGQYSGSLLPAAEADSFEQLMLEGNHTEKRIGQHHVEFLIQYGLKIAEAAGRFGYFGPIGIDSMIYRGVDGRLFVRPANDINGRYTMGRVALSLGRGPGGAAAGAWLCIPGKVLRDFGKDLANLLPKSVRMERTSPGRIGDRPVTMASVFLISDDIEAVYWSFKTLQNYSETSKSSS
ncbi:MAG: hypothetical protein JNL58_28010 [Planctomyces sp.]|nr:hypothetical protein [Planctomyces sp.]